jgi:putative ABC transport system ATP-binding protein
LDSENGKSVLELLLEFQKERRTTLVLVTHSADIARIANRMIVLKDGRITAEESISKR